MNKNLQYEDLIGVPFANHGRDPRTGLDCYGVVMEIYKRCGIRLPEYDADWNDCRKISQFISGATASPVWQEIRPEDIDNNVPCVLAIRFGVPKGVINHTAVYVGNGKFLHARDRTGVCVERISSPAWRRIIEGFYVYKG